MEQLDNSQGHKRAASSTEVCPDPGSWIGFKNALSVLVFILQPRPLPIPKSVGNLTPAGAAELGTRLPSANLARSVGGALAVYPRPSPLTPGQSPPNNTTGQSWPGLGQSQPRPSPPLRAAAARAEPRAIAPAPPPCPIGCREPFPHCPAPRGLASAAAPRDPRGWAVAPRSAFL